MALGDMWVERGPVVIQKFQVKAGAAASIKAGEPVIQNTSGDAEYVKSPGADVTTSDTFVGIATSTSTDTATADGEVYVAMPTFGTVFRGKAKTIGSLSTANMLTKVIIDYTAPNYTVDESVTTNGLCLMVGMNTTTGEVDWMLDMTEAINA